MSEAGNVAASASQLTAVRPTAAQLVVAVPTTAAEPTAPEVASEAELTEAAAESLAPKAAVPSEHESQRLPAAAQPTAADLTAESIGRKKYLGESFYDPKVGIQEGGYKTVRVHRSYGPRSCQCLRARGVQRG